VNILGLFGSPEVHRLEYERCQKALEGARRNCARADECSLGSNTGMKLATRIARRARSAYRSTRGVLESRRDFTLEYSSGDFSYRSENLDEALDLLARCSKSKPRRF
jgi:hypothetical protein